MKTCQSCGLENPPDRDFCECGEYLRWEPTGVMEAVAPPPGAPQGAVRPTARWPVARHEPPAAEESASVTITLRLPDRDGEKAQTLATAVEPGERERVLALVRNQSGIVDNYQLRIDGLPEDWWSIYPDTIYLVPFGTGGTYEQEVEIHLHPPRTPDAEAKMWDLKVVAHSRAHEVTAAGAPLALVIKPYTETTTNVRPERKKGRRKATFDVDVSNKGNAPVLIALEGEDPDGEMSFGFTRPPSQIPPGQTVTTSMRVRPPKQIWIGRSLDRRMAVETLTGEEAQARLAAEPTSAKGGTSFREPQFQGPQMQGPQLKQMNVDMNSLRGKLGSSGGGSPSAPLLPSQAVFKQLPWLPWWLVPVAITLAATAVLLYMLLPRNVVVPDLVGTKSTFEAEKTLHDAELKLAPVTKPRVDRGAPIGSVVDQVPAAGEKTEKDSEVTVLVAVGSREVTVPELTGLTLSDADAALRRADLSLGQSSPQPPDLEGKIKSQIPAAASVVKEGTPVSVFFADPNDSKGDRTDGASDPSGEDTPGGSDALVVPAIDGKAAAFAKRLADLGLVPRTKTVYDAAPAGTVLSTTPREGAEVRPSTVVQLRVSAGSPLLAYDDEQDVLLVDGFSGDRVDVLARTPTIDKDPTFSADGERVAYQADGQILQADVDDPDEPPVELTRFGDQYSNLAFAPTPKRDVLAMLRAQPSGLSELCVGRVVQRRMNPTCVDPPPGVRLTRTLRWSPDGRTLLVLGFTMKRPSEFGMVRYRSPRAFSANAADWRTSGYATDITQPERGVLDAAYSPDGKRLAIVSNLTGPGEFRVSLTSPARLDSDPGTPLPVTGCKVVWRPDGIELVVMQNDDCVRAETGRLLGVPLGHPRDQRTLQEEGSTGDNPVFQPLTFEP